MKYALILCALFLASCGKEVPEFPQVSQCVFKVKYQAFYCVDNKTKARVKISVQDFAMDAAQCLSAEDYKKSERWIGDVRAIAEEKCK